MRIRVAVTNFFTGCGKNPVYQRLDPWKGLDLHFLSGPPEQFVPLIPPGDWGRSSLWNIVCIFKISVKTRIIYHHKNPVKLKLQRVWIAVFNWSGSELWVKRQAVTPVTYFERKDRICELCWVAIYMLPTIDWHWYGACKGHSNSCYNAFTSSLWIRSILKFTVDIAYRWASP